MAIDLQAKQQLAIWLAKPASVTQADAALLTALIETYPYYQPLHLLLAKAKSDTEPHLLATAALYNGGALLHKTLHHADTFSAETVNLVPSIKSSQPQTTASEHEIFEEITESAFTAEPGETHKFDLPATAEEETDVDDEVFEEITEATLVPENRQTVTQQNDLPATAEEETDVDDEVFEEITEATLVPENRQKEIQQNDLPATAEEETDADDEVFEEITEATLVPENRQTETQQNDLPATAEEETDADAEVFEEITEATLVPENRQTITQQNDLPATAEEETDVDDEVFEEITEATSVPENQAELPPNDKAALEVLPDELAIGSIVATDFFAFEQNFSTEQDGTASSTVTFTPPEEYNTEAEKQTVSKYDDDKLPFTFLWWLAKTRKEHAQIFQPYVTAKKQTAPVAGELHHQYVEHIFHLQTPFNIASEANKLTEQSVSHKGGDIIDSFIKNEPQIGTPKADQINTENKAKKSAEDNYDLVSETLAAIYIEQMLYHKAIDTYEKLSLKFPEKSRYFADLIQSLEKKI